jgi:hypothetical protein
MSTERLWLKGISSWCTDDFQTSASLRIGLPADIVRIENGMLAEHWDVIEDEVTREVSQSGLPMFGEEFSK